MSAPTFSRKQLQVGIKRSRLRELGYEDYSDYIKSSRWKNTRARYRSSDRPQDCAICGAGDPIILHHRTYERLGAEALDDLLPLCLSCHEMVHELERRQSEEVGPEALIDAVRATQYAEQRELLVKAADLATAERIRKSRRRICDSLRGLLKQAQYEVADIDDELAAIEEQVALIRAKLRPRS